jgi:hypothetical protein
MHGIEPKQAIRVASEEKLKVSHALVIRRNETNNHTDDEDY